MRNFDSFEFCKSPRTGGLTGIASRLACRFDWGSPESSSATSSSNNQVTTQGGGTGSQTQAVGATTQSGYDETNLTGSTNSAAFGHVYEQGTDNSNSETIINNSLDASVANESIEASSNVAGYAVQAEGMTAANALQFGAETEAGNNAFASQTVSQAFGFGAEALDASLASSTAANNNALNDVTNLAAYSEQGAQNSLESVEQTNQSLADELGQITQQTAPQSAAYEAEALTGQTNSGSNQLTTYAVLAGAALSVLVFFNSKGKAA